MPFTSVPYALWAEKALTVRDDSITTKQIKNGTIRPEDLDPAFSFANVSGQAADGQIPGTISRMIDLTNHINAPVGHQAIQIGVNQNFATFVANNVQQALEKIDQRLRDEIDNRKGGVGTVFGKTKKEEEVRGVEDGKIRDELKAHAALKTGVHGLTSTDPTSAIVGTLEEQTLSKKTLDAPKILGGGVGKATLKYDKADVSRTLTIPSTGLAEDKIVTETSTQTMTNKTLTSPVITSGSFSGTLAKDTVDTASIQGSAITSDKIKDGTITTADIGSTAGITDAQVSDILTASIFKASDSKTSAIDLDTGEVAGILPLGKITSDSVTTKALFAGGPAGPGYRAITNDDVPDDITINLAKTATTAGTASSLAANGADCPEGQYARGVDASGKAEGCAAAATGTVTSVIAGSGLKTGLPKETITSTGTIEVDYSKLNGVYVRKDGSTMTEDLGMAVGKTVDGVDVSAHDHSGTGKGGTISYRNLSMRPMIESYIVRKSVFVNRSSLCKSGDTAYCNCSDANNCALRASCDDDKPGVINVRTGCGGEYNFTCGGDDECDLRGFYPEGSRTCITKIWQNMNEDQQIVTYAFCLRFENFDKK